MEKVIKRIGAIWILTFVFIVLSISQGYANADLVPQYKIGVHIKNGILKENRKLEVIEIEGIPVRFHANGGYFGGYSEEEEEMNQVNVFPIPKKEGYAFIGWSISKESIDKETARYFNHTDAIISDLGKRREKLDLYAHWTEDKSNQGIYVIRLNPMKGKVDPIFVYTNAEGRMEKEVIPEREEYVFKGWSIASEKFSRETDAIKRVYTRNAEIFAHWEEKIAIHFDPTGGSVSPTEIKIPKGGTLPSVPIPTREGYTFKGWSISMGAYNPKDKIDENRVFEHETWLFAHWDENIITIHFDPRGGTVSPTEIRIPRETTLPSIPIPTKEGYHFKGWSTSMGAYNPIDENRVFERETWLFAYWEEMITIHFDPTGGNVSPTEIKIPKGSTLPNIPIPTKERYLFRCWSISAGVDGEGYRIDKNTVFEYETWLFAHWDKFINIREDLRDLYRYKGISIGF